MKSYLTNIYPQISSPIHASMYEVGKNRRKTILHNRDEHSRASYRNRDIYYILDVSFIYQQANPIC